MTRNGWLTWWNGFSKYLPFLYAIVGAFHYLLHLTHLLHSLRMKYMALEMVGQRITVEHNKTVERYGINAVEDRSSDGGLSLCMFPGISLSDALHTPHTVPQDEVNGSQNGRAKNNREPKQNGREVSD